MSGIRLRTVGAVLLLPLLCVAGGVRAEDSAPAALPTGEEILDDLKRALAWYQQARQAMQTAREAAIVLPARDDEPTIVRALQRAFDAARAQGALLAEPAPADASAGDTPQAPPATRRAERRTKLEAAIREDERQVALLREKARTTPAARREPVERDLTRALNRLELDRLRLELLANLEQSESALGSGETDLLQQIQALQESVPELNASAPPQASPRTAPAATTAPTTSAASTAASSEPGTWSAVSRLLALQRARASLSQLTIGTDLLAHDVETRVEATRTLVRELSRRLREQVGAVSTAAVTDQATFRRELEHLKHLGALLVPLRAESALLRRFENDIRIWQRAIDRETRRGLQELGLGLVGVVIGLGAIALGAVVSRAALERYVQDPYRKRLLLRARKIAVGAAVVLVLVFHFTSELTALVTALGFAAAGVAFALQNVILSVAGYFSMMSPNGIRMGDRVSLQGPFGYVHGEVIEIGMVRIRLRELSPDTLEPTGRVVVSPNSVVFTGSFLKHPPAQAKAA